MRLRRGPWRLGAPARGLLIGLIHLYQATLSGWFGGQCRFYPSCSHYAEEAIRTHGALRGSMMSGWRILRCNPFGAGGVDHVADTPFEGSCVYDSLIPTKEQHEEMVAP